MNIDNEGNFTQIKQYDKPSIFSPENLLREARRQKNIPDCDVPPICILDPDGDVVDYLEKNQRCQTSNCWACYHSHLHVFSYNQHTLGIVGRVVGSSYAVLVAEQLFVSGCKLLISITSAGVINSNNKSEFIIITESLRDEGTSYHYIAPHEKSELNPHLLERLQPMMTDSSLSVSLGKSWTTDAPYRETQSAIDHAKSLGITAVEMESSALYAFAKAKNKSVVCFAHLTNNMAVKAGDFEKGEENGSMNALLLIGKTINCLLKSQGITDLKI